MKPVPAISLFLAFSSAAVVQPRRASYDGYKVLRLAVGDEAEKLNGIVSRLNLPTWKGAPRAGAFADIVVPPAQFEEFSKEVVDMDAIVMHEDLGASIAAESAFNFYAGASVHTLYETDWS